MWHACVSNVHNWNLNLKKGNLIIGIWILIIPNQMMFHSPLEYILCHHVCVMHQRCKYPDHRKMSFHNWNFVLWCEFIIGIWILNHTKPDDVPFTSRIYSLPSCVCNASTVQISRPPKNCAASSAHILYCGVNSHSSRCWQRHNKISKVTELSRKLWFQWSDIIVKY